MKKADSEKELKEESKKVKSTKETKKAPKEEKVDKTEKVKKAKEEVVAVEPEVKDEKKLAKNSAKKEKVDDTKKEEKENVEVKVETEEAPKKKRASKKVKEETDEVQNIVMEGFEEIPVVEEKKTRKRKAEEVAVEEKVEEPVVETPKKDNKKEDKSEEKDKVTKILSTAKEKGNITYGELAAELGEVNPEQIEKVFDAFEELGVSVLKDDVDFLEPDLDDLSEVEDIKLEEMNVVNIEGVSVDDPVRMYLREIGRIPLLSFEE